jgi:hypothetical protein
MEGLAEHEAVTRHGAAIAREAVLVRELSLLERALNRALSPLMYIAGGLKRDSVQETHAWTCQPLRTDQLDPALGAEVRGDDESKASNSRFPFPRFHVPILGGWRSFVVLQVELDSLPWYVGWLHIRVPERSKRRMELQRLPIRDRAVRVLKHPTGFVTLFVGYDSLGRQIPVRLIAEGRLGLGGGSGLRLF